MKRINARRAAVAGLAFAVWVLGLALAPVAGAQEGTVTPGATPTGVATPSATPPAAGATPAASPSPATAATPGARFEIAGRLVEDLNGDGVADSGDGWAPAPTVVPLYAWRNLRPPTPSSTPAAVPTIDSYQALVDSEIQMLSADDGSFRFTNIPPGDYTFEVWWAGGFVDGGADRLPDLYRAVIRIQADGSVAAPAPLPSFWPESLGSEAFNPAADRTSIGAVPPVILLKKKPANMFPYPISTGSAQITARGVLDVGSVLRQRDSRVALPSLGVGSTEPATAGRWLPAAALAVLALGAGAVLVRARRRG